MKDSGIDWIGSIPSNWTFARIGSLYGLRVEKVSDRDYPPLSVTKLGILPQLETVAKTNAHDDRKLVKIGDFAINSRSDRRGSCGISEYEGSVSLINTVLYPIADMNPQYYNWLFHTVEFADEFYRWGHGIVDDLWTTGWQDMKSIVIIQPPLSEQRRIAAFLSVKCAEIDALTADIQSQIDTLEQYKRSVITEAVTRGLNPGVEMRDSRIAWMGMMPSHWAVKRTKFLFEIVKRIAGKEGFDVLSVTQKGLKVKDLSDYSGQIAENYSGYQFVYPTDYVMNHMDLLTGWVDCSESFGVTSPDYRVFRLLNQDEHDLAYFKYVFQCLYMNKIYYSFGNGVSGMGRWRLQTSTFLNFLLPVPSRAEQHQIAEFIGSKVSEIDSIIDVKKQQLETLNEYKKSLIFEYVTGKKEVSVTI